ncbi:MAG: hypothetical protein ICV78_09965 [Tolypothrix sp. Co-bin9]|nr:hypothetical protein [Tolypothrix sp. Co-bin9]
MATSFKNPLNKIITLTIVVFVVLLILYIPLKYVELQGYVNTQNELSPIIENIANKIWTFISPILQLTLLLILVDWILHKFGIDYESEISKRFNLNVQVIIAVVIIGSFALAALANLNQGLGYLKDLSLVVVGFYFGTQRKTVEIKNNEGELKVTEEHTNPIKEEKEDDNSNKDKGTLPS